MNKVGRGGGLYPSVHYEYIATAVTRRMAGSINRYNQQQLEEAVGRTVSAPSTSPVDYTNILYY